MSFDPILRFELKQHTPMIHFQHDQPGATLRGSELKPKFDKFLIEYVFKGDRNKYKKYLIKDDSEKEAFDYKVKIISKTINCVDIRDTVNYSKNYPLFFGNMGQQTNIKKFSYTPDPLTVEFFCLNEKLQKIIKEYFPLFLMNTNFGTRNSKGFGSFYIDQADPNYKPYGLRYYFKVKPNAEKYFDKVSILMNHIEIFYKSLRSGINLSKVDPSFYFKSMMFLYAKSKGIQWDKKSIKEHFFRNDLQNQKKIHGNSEILNYSSEKKYLVKELLGLSSEEMWLSYDKAKIKRKSEGIERFPSPIFFKPIQKNDHFIVYFDIKPLDDRIFDKLFEISNTRDRQSGTLTLKTPPKGVIDLHEFIRFAVSQDLDEHVENKYKKHEYFGILKDIYSQVKSSIEKNSKTNSSGGSNA